MSDSVRPFTVAIPDSDLDDLHARLRNTRWGDAEVVDDWSQGIPLEYVRDVATYWAEKYDWRAREAAAQPRSLSSSPRSTGSTSTSITFAHRTTTRCRSSSPMDGRGRSSSSRR